MKIVDLAKIIIPRKPNIHLMKLMTKVCIWNIYLWLMSFANCNFLFGGIFNYFLCRFYFILFVYGNISILSEKQCQEGRFHIIFKIKSILIENSFFWNVALSYLIICYLYFMVPVLSIFSICICFSRFLQFCKFFCLQFAKSDFVYLFFLMFS